MPHIAESSILSSGEKTMTAAANLRNLAALESVKFGASSTVEFVTPNAAVESGNRGDFWEAAEPPPGRMKSDCHRVLVKSCHSFLIINQ